MEEKVLKEIKQIKQLLSEIVGTSELPAREKFSKEAITKCAKEFRKLSIERGAWLSDHDIDKVIKKAPWRAGKLIIEKFGFTNYFKRGHTLYYNKKDLIALNAELKKRNINLEEYSDLLEDQAKFKKKLDSIELKKGHARFIIPEKLRDINSKPQKPPDEGIVREEIEALLGEYDKFDLSEYVSLYSDKTYAMFKYEYSFERYLKPELKKYCKNWCFKFNYANNALKKILEYKNY